MPNDKVTITMTREELERLIDILNTKFHVDSDIRHILRILTSGKVDVDENALLKA
jgi:hypothetical protein